jgi:hypothetical protein
VDTFVSGKCRKDTCFNAIPPSLADQQICLDHFLEEAFQRTGQAMERFRQGRPIEPTGLERLLADALAIVNNLEEGADEPNPEKRDRMLELLLSLANLHEYAASHSINMRFPS